MNRAGGASKVTNQPVDDLTTSLIELASIVADGLGFQATLQQIANYAATVHRDTHGAAITMSEGGRPSALVSTEPLVGEAEQLQYDIAEGPARRLPPPVTRSCQVPSEATGTGPGSVRGWDGWDYTA